MPPQEFHLKENLGFIFYIINTAKTNHISCFSCPMLHRTAGDTERRYHLRYYKTGMCVHDTDNR